MKPFGHRITRLFHSIGFELLVYYLSISIVVLAVGSWLVYNSTINVLQKRSEEYIHEQFKQADYNIQSLSNEVDRISRTFLIETDVQSLMQATSIDYSYDSLILQQDVVKLINKYLNGNDLIDSMYIFTKDGVIGSNRMRTNAIPSGGRHAFYTSGLYDKAIAAFPKPVWNTGITDEWFYGTAGSPRGNPVISFAKGAKPELFAKLNTVLVLNIDESRLCDTYSSFAAPGADVMYIMDEKGTVVSSVDKKAIGTKGPFVPDPGADFKSFDMSFGGKSELVVYYRISDTDWYIVRETPLGVFANDVIVLRNVMVFVLVISILLIVGASLYTMRRIAGPLGLLAARMKDVGRGNLGITIKDIPKNELGLVTMRFNEMSLSISELMDRNAEVEREKNELEMEALKYQINPHFLFNTLNMIKWMAAVVRAENIMDSLTALINILHPLYNNYDPLWSLEEEVKCLENYIKIMNWRFKYKISFRFDIPCHMLEFKIIKFILQPVIENSITHGVGELNNRIEITVRAAESGGGILMSVTDNGVGISGDNLERLTRSLNMTLNRNIREKNKSIGLSNVNRRIKLNFGEAYGICIESRVGEGTTVSISLPKLPDEKNAITG